MNWITNIFASETGRPLRGGHKDHAALPAHLSTDDGFLAVPDYARLVKQFCDDHPTVSCELGGVTSDYNRIRRFRGGKFAKEVQQIEGAPQYPWSRSCLNPHRGSREGDHDRRL